MLPLLALGSAIAVAAPPQQPTFEIAPGVLMPWISNGAVGYPKHDQEQAAMQLWLTTGGLGLDTAWSYKNQAQVGYAMGNTTIPRSKIFLTTKIPCLGSAEAALERIKLDQAQLCNGGQSAWCSPQPFADLVLIHEPNGACKTPAQQQATWRGLEMALYALCCPEPSCCLARRCGALTEAQLTSAARRRVSRRALNLTRSIGVSNFVVSDLEAIAKTAKIPPAANQCSMHIGRHDDATIAYCKAHHIQYEAYSPLGGPDLGGKSVMSYPEVISIAKAHNVSGAQVALRWVLQQDIAVVTATGSKQYMTEDLDVAGITLTPDEMKMLSAVTGNPP